MELKQHTIRLSLIFIVCLISGCVSIPKQAFDKSTKANIKSITLLQVQDPTFYYAVDTSGAGGIALGYSNAVVNHSYEFTHLMSGQELQVGNRLTQELISKLENSGYSVNVLRGVRPKGTNNLDADFSNIKTDGDAIMDVRVNVIGYTSAVFSKEFRPWIGVSSRLVNAQNYKQLYFEVFGYGPDNSIGQDITHIPQSGNHRYGSFHEITSNLEEAGKVLLIGIPIISDAISKQL